MFLPPWPFKAKTPSIRCKPGPYKGGNGKIGSSTPIIFQLGEQRPSSQQANQGQSGKHNYQGDESTRGGLGVVFGNQHNGLLQFLQGRPLGVRWVSLQYRLLFATLITEYGNRLQIATLFATIEP
jgi:hypothetical protein